MSLATNSQVLISEAAKLVGKHPTTLKAAIKKGKLSATKNINGEWVIDIAEVTRVYPIKNNSLKFGDNNIIDNSYHNSASVLEEENKILKQENALLEQKTASLREALEKAELTTKQFYDLALQNGKLLAHFQDGKEVTKEEPTKRKRSWFKS